MLSSLQFVGIIPMAGRATRMPGILSSKELLPFGSARKPNGEIGKKVISEVLIERIKNAGVKKFHFVIRKGKWDIPEYFGGGLEQQIDISYHIADNESAVPFSINQVYSFAKGKNIIVGFPDIFFLPEDAVSQLVDELTVSTNKNIDMILGLFPVTDPRKWDAVETNETDLVSAIHIKNMVGKDPGYVWIIAAWRPAFTEFLYHWLGTNNLKMGEPEIQLGNIIMDFINSGYKVKGKYFRSGTCIDTGTPEKMNEALNRFAQKMI